MCNWRTRVRRPRANRHRFPAGNSAVAGKDPLLAWAVRWKWTSTCAGALWRLEASSPFSSSSCSSSRAAAATTSPRRLPITDRRHRRGRRRPADNRGLHRPGRRDLRPRQRRRRRPRSRGPGRRARGVPDHLRRAGGAPAASGGRRRAASCSSSSPRWRTSSPPCATSSARSHAGDTAADAEAQLAVDTAEVDARELGSRYGFRECGQFLDAGEQPGGGGAGRDRYRDRARTDTGAVAPPTDTGDGRAPDRYRHGHAARRPAPPARAGGLRRRHQPLAA